MLRDREGDFLQGYLVDISGVRTLALAESFDGVSIGKVVRIMGGYMGSNSI
ncbi:MAG: hypothetical protein J7K33_09325 [Candidatus Marinimicrobia bacterium]|nr:hypothetical protein [Candidatus Neomarinimicrobiota bacterium]